MAGIIWSDGRQEASVSQRASTAAQDDAAPVVGSPASPIPPWMIAQVQLVRQGYRFADESCVVIESQTAKLLTVADQSHPRLIARRWRSAWRRGAQARRRHHRGATCSSTAATRWGRNLLNTVAEAIAPKLEQITRGGGRAAHPQQPRRSRGLARQLSDSGVGVDGGEIDGATWPSASSRPRASPSSTRYRAATHNKGIIERRRRGRARDRQTTGARWRLGPRVPVKDGRYGPLATWRVRREASGAAAPIVALDGEISLPTAVGVVGGATRSHRQRA